ncbi:hypothetical protein B0H15DRAFT_820131 [Mycena belliarum]|uniref:Uncharacterized protein n=1 Tax=Mycena belliarum TaxID=1033014 RepID=A0AAD6UCV2_9AGAR|nr:hypothetical protein B0H15DRAFT_820108 [Mycena belliae]KAJ7099398.1 hypothetical protein B0H15DRAFT_820131 [Mycena belliae]
MRALRASRGRGGTRSRVLSFRGVGSRSRPRSALFAHAGARRACCGAVGARRRAARSSRRCAARSVSSAHAGGSALNGQACAALAFPAAHSALVRRVARSRPRCPPLVLGAWRSARLFWGRRRSFGAVRVSALDRGLPPAARLALYAHAGARRPSRGDVGVRRRAVRGRVGLGVRARFLPLVRRCPRVRALIGVAGA